MIIIKSYTSRFEIDELVSMVWCCCNASRLANESWEMMSTMSQVALERRHFSHGFCLRSIFRLCNKTTESLRSFGWIVQNFHVKARRRQRQHNLENEEECLCFFICWSKIKEKELILAAFFLGVLCCECVPVSRIPAVTFWTSVRVSDIDQKDWLA